MNALETSGRAIAPWQGKSGLWSRTGGKWRVRISSPEICPRRTRFLCHSRLLANARRNHLLWWQRLGCALHIESPNLRNFRINNRRAFAVHSATRSWRKSHLRGRLEISGAWFTTAAAEILHRETGHLRAWQGHERFTWAKTRLRARHINTLRVNFPPSVDFARTRKNSRQISVEHSRAKMLEAQGKLAKDTIQILTVFSLLS